MYLVTLLLIFCLYNDIDLMMVFTRPFLKITILLPILTPPCWSQGFTSVASQPQIKMYLML